MRRCALVLAFMLVAGCGGDKPKFTEAELAHMPLPKRTGLPEASGGFVLAVKGETITADEIVSPLIEAFKPVARGSSLEQFKAQARGEVEKVLMAKVSDILLYQQAKKNAGERIDEALDRAVEAEMRKFLIRYDNDYAKAEEALKRQGINWLLYKEYQKRMMLSQSYIRQKLPEQEPITYSELLARYNEMKEEFFAVPAMLKFRLIDIEVDKVEITDPNENRQEKAKQLANELSGRLQGGEDFGELAKQYSHGHRRLFGGLWKPVQPDSLAEPYDILGAEAEKISPGQIAGPIEAGGHIFIMKLEEKRAKSVEPLEKVQKQVEDTIIFDRRKKAIDEFSAELVQQAALSNMEVFMDFCLEEIYRICNQ